MEMNGKLSTFNDQIQMDDSDPNPLAPSFIEGRDETDGGVNCTAIFWPKVLNRKLGSFVIAVYIDKIDDNITEYALRMIWKK